MEICPRCNQLSNLNSSISHSTVNKNEITTTSFHCANCGSFIRSENSSINMLHEAYKRTLARKAKNNSSNDSKRCESVKRHREWQENMNTEDFLNELLNDKN